MLKAHQACIDLQKGVLRIQDREVRFLSEHELPEKARDPLEPAEFPGEGRVIGAPSTTPATPAPAVQRPSQAAPSPGSRYSERDIRVLMDLGATREIAISTLDAANGNVDVAASLLF
jgi:DNA damage-inducible protein 1